MTQPRPRDRDIMSMRLGDRLRGRNKIFSTRRVGALPFHTRLISTIGIVSTSGTKATPLVGESCNERGTRLTAIPDATTDSSVAIDSAS